MYSKKIQIAILFSIIILIVTTALLVIEYYDIADLTVIKAFMSFIIPYFIGAIAKELEVEISRIFKRKPKNKKK